MRKLPPASMTSLPSAFLSVLVHSAVIITTLIAMPAAAPMPVTSQVYVPIELVTVADTTNLTAVAAADAKAEEVIESAAAEAAAAPAPPPVDEDTVSLEPPQEKPKEPPKKQEAKANPAPSKSFSSELDDILSSVDKTPKNRGTSAGTAPASATPTVPRLSAGDKRRMTASITDIIVSQLRDKACWADHSDMADAKRLKATYRVWFGRNGKFSQTPELIDPSRKPANDPPLNTFIVHAERALNKCNQIGWYVPEEYFRLPQPAYLDLEFLPKIGASQ
jgi:hypothetical protein